MTLTKIFEVVACGGEDWAVAFTDARRPSSAHINKPDFLLNSGRIARRVWIFSCLILALAPHVSDGAAAGREDEIRQLLSIVIVVPRQLPRDKRWRFASPDVAFAFSIKHPGDLVTLPRHCKLRGKGRAHHLFEGECLCARRRGSEKQCAEN